VEDAGRRATRRGATLLLAALAVATLAFAARTDAFVYWTEKGPGEIGRANHAGSPDVNLTFVSGLDQPQAIAVDGAHIYWTTGFGSIGRADLNGGNVNGNFILGTFGAKGVAVDSEHIYWTDTVSGSHIGRANLDGSSPNQTFIATAIPAAGVVVDGGHVYWANSGSNAIGRANLDGSSPDQIFIRGASNPQGVAVDGAHLYWTNTNSGWIGRANLDGTGANQDFIFAGAPQDVEVDGNHVWWANGPHVYGIGQANLDASSPTESVFSTLSTPTGIAIDAGIAPSPGPSPGPPTIVGMVAQVRGAGLQRGVERSLLAKLDVAQRKLDDGNRQAACGTLSAFANEAQARGQATELSDQATAIRELLGCGGD
jgi:sugar lactone lactonase YvrE